LLIRTEIKKTYGMDFASLSKLRNSANLPVATTVKTEPIEPVKSGPAVVKQETVRTSGNSSDKVSLEDFATRSMSISDAENDTSRNIGTA